MIENLTNTKEQTKLFFSNIKTVDDTIPFVFDVSALLRTKLENGVNTFNQEGRTINVVPYNDGFRGWIYDEEKGAFPIIYADSECVDIYPGWNLFVIKNKEIEMFLKNRFFVDAKGQFVESSIIKNNKTFLDITSNSVYKSAWVMIKKGADMLPYYIKNKYLDNNQLFLLESQEKVLVFFGDKDSGYYRYSFLKESLNNNFWFYSFAGFDDLGYKIDERKRCLTDISPQNYLLSSRKFIIFDDPLMAIIIKSQLNISGRGLTSIDLLLLKELDLEDYKLYSINGIEYCLGLQVLKIRGLYISGLEKVARSLPSLKKIHLSKELYSNKELKELYSFL